MKNIDKYKKEIFWLIDKGDSPPCAIANVAGISAATQCKRTCSECQAESFEWMYSEKPNLTDEEKNIIKVMLDVILKFGCEVNYVKKQDDIYGKAYILLSYVNNLTKYSDIMTTPWFKNDKFKGMEIGKEYKLEELGLENMNG